MAVCFTPEHVLKVLRHYRRLLAQDAADTLRMAEGFEDRYRRYRQHGGDDPPMAPAEYIRSKLVFPRTRKPADHKESLEPYVVNVLRRIGIPEAPITEFVHLIIEGDLADFRLVSRLSKPAVAAVDKAIEVVERQWEDGSPEVTSSDRSRNRTADDDYVFWRDGDHYYIRAFGESGTIGPLKGIQQLHLLIESQGRPVPMVDLDRCSQRPSPGHVESSSRQEILDSEYRDKIGKRLRQLDSELATARDRGDTLVAGELEEEITQLSQQLEENLGLGGKSRQFADGRDKARSRIAGTLRTAYEKLEQSGLPDTAEHLRKSIRADSTGVPTFMYDPAAKSISWSVD